MFHEMLPIGLASLVIALATTWAVTPLVIRAARLINAVDHPTGRKMHAAPTPRIGGLAVFCGFVGGLGFAAWASGTLFDLPEVDVYWWGLAAAATAMMFVGLVDDTRGLSFRAKFVAQTLGAVFVWFCGFRVDVVSSPLGGGGFELGWLSLPLTVLWIVAVTNAVNLIDGLDGLATGIALITTSSVAAISFVRGELGVTAASVALAGSLAGFLIFNFNPARIFLGDSGSIFLGFVLAVTSVRGSQKGPTAVAVLVPLLTLALPLLDTGFAIFRRLYRLRGEGLSNHGGLRYVLFNIRRVFMADRGHIHHRLIDRGLTQRRAVVLLYGFGCLTAFGALALVVLKSAVIAAVLVVALSLLMSSFLLLYSAPSARPSSETTVEAQRVAAGPSVTSSSPPGSAAS
jgi:UDP-GlcNAc:undecaprenyl-phosphate GlcNAc-1-phosphate transferase